MRLNADQNGRICMINNKEFTELHMAWTKTNAPEVFQILTRGFDPKGSPLKGLQDYKSLSKQDKQKVRWAKIKFIKWFNKNYATEDTQLQVPTMREPNSLGEKLYD